MEIKFWKVGCADAITIRFKDSDGVYRNVFIDGGYVGTYRYTIKKELLAIEASDENVDLWIITHTDGDHIGGVESFVKDRYFEGKKDMVRKYWFNWSAYEIVLPSEQISVSQGIRLRDYLLKTRADSVQDIIAGGADIFFAGVRFTILSPDAGRLEKSKIQWSKEEVEKMVSGRTNDYSRSIEDLRKETIAEDTEVWNGGSIAFILQYVDQKMLFLADSHPSAVVETLRQLGYSKENKLPVSFVKLSHHGSSGNINEEFLSMIECNTFVILANGINHSLPNKAALVSILTHPERNYSETIEFFFSDDTPQLRSIFAVDSGIENLNFRCNYISGDFFSLTFS